jgi:hypothetical protein
MTGRAKQRSAHRLVALLIEQQNDSVLDGLQEWVDWRSCLRLQTLNRASNPEADEYDDGVEDGVSRKAHAPFDDARAEIVCIWRLAGIAPMRRAMLGAEATSARRAKVYIDRRAFERSAIAAKKVALHLSPSVEAGRMTRDPADTTRETENQSSRQVGSRKMPRFSC